MSCTVTLKEIFLNKRRLLTEVRPDLIDQVMSLLEDARDPRYIDFLLSICTADGGPMPAIQRLICEALVRSASRLLPIFSVSRTEAGFSVAITVPGTRLDPTTIHIDLANFDDSKQVMGRDFASHILTAPFGELSRTQKAFRYAVRCINLYGKLCVGRNQDALTFFLTSPAMPWKYDTLLELLREEKLPALLRARLTTLMLDLYVDRDPQTSKPQILYTRTWSSVVPEESDWKEGENVPTLPVCTTGFSDLCALLLEQIPKLGGATGRDGKPSLNHTPLFGQLELLSAQLALCDLMLDFGFFTHDRDSINCDLTEVRRLFESVFSIVDTRGVAVAPSKRREAVMLIKLRSSALKLLIRMLNLRANFRMSLCLQVWETIFAKQQSQRCGYFTPGLVMHETRGLLSVAEGQDSRARRSSIVSSFSDLDKGSKEDLLQHMFDPFAHEIEKLCDDLFERDIISADKIQADTYRPGDLQGNAIVDAMLNLTGFEDSDLTSQACSLLLRHISQRSRVMSDIATMQVLVFPRAVRVYHEVQEAIKRLTALRKHLSAERPEAYTEAIAVLVRMKEYLTQSEEFPEELVFMNQRIMMDHELDEPIVDILRMPLERDTTRRMACLDPAEADSDPARNSAQRELFQHCYDLIGMLCRRNSQAQSKLFEFMPMFQDNVGIEQLNVADTLAEMVRDNTKLISQVPESLIRRFCTAIQTWGRKARWLRIFEVLLFVNGWPFKRNQDLVLRILLEDWEWLLDLKCDYRSSRFLPRNDPRLGKTLLDLIQDGDHRLKVTSASHFSEPTEPEH